MDTQIVLLVCSFIAAIGGAFVAIKNIFEISGRPFNFVKKRQTTALKEVFEEFLEKKMPDVLLKHDLQTREKYLSDRQKYLEEIKQEVLTSIQLELQEVEELQCKNEKLDNVLEKITISLDNIEMGMKNVLREKINVIFNRHRKDQTLSFHEKEEVETYYRDYKSIGGNSYIDDRMELLRTWKVIDEH